MNLKLDVVRLNNEDVIATSVVGIGIVNQNKDSFTWFFNGDSIYDGKVINGDYSAYDSLGVYHVDSDGKIVEACGSNHGNVQDEKLEYHGIEIPG